MITVMKHFIDCFQTVQLFPYQNMEESLCGHSFVIHWGMFYTVHLSNKCVFQVRYHSNISLTSWPHFDCLCMRCHGN